MRQPCPASASPAGTANAPCVTRCPADPRWPLPGRRLYASGGADPRTPGVRCDAVSPADPLGSPQSAPQGSRCPNPLIQHWGFSGTGPCPPLHPDLRFGSALTCGLPGPALCHTPWGQTPEVLLFPGCVLQLSISVTWTSRSSPALLCLGGHSTPAPLLAWLTPYLSFKTA